MTVYWDGEACRCASLLLADGSQLRFTHTDDTATPCRVEAIAWASSGEYRVPVCADHKAEGIYRLDSQRFGYVGGTVRA